MAKDQFQFMRARIFKILFILPQTISLMKTTVAAARRGAESVSLVEFGNMKRFTPQKRMKLFLQTNLKLYPRCSSAYTKLAILFQCA